MAKGELPKRLPVSPNQELTVEPDSPALRAIAADIIDDGTLAQLVVKHAKKSLRIDRRVMVRDKTHPATDKPTHKADATPPAGTRSMPRPEDVPNDTVFDVLRSAASGKLGKAVVGTLAISTLIGTGVAYEVYGPNEASATAGSVEHRVVQNPDKLRALGLCANELIAQAEFNQRTNSPSDIGFSAQDYYDAARFAQANEIPCFPDRTAVVVSNDQELKAATAERISMFDAENACDQRAAADHGEAGNTPGTNPIVASIDRTLIAAVNLTC